MQYCHGMDWKGKKMGKTLPWRSCPVGKNEMLTSTSYLLAILEDVLAQQISDSGQWGIVSLCCLFLSHIACRSS
jgi:hypothetical protein